MQGSGGGGECARRRLLYLGSPERRCGITPHIRFVSETMPGLHSERARSSCAEKRGDAKVTLKYKGDSKDRELIANAPT